MVITERAVTQQSGMSANDVERLITEASHIVSLEEAWTRLNDILAFYGQIEVQRESTTPPEMLESLRAKIKECWALKHDLNLTLKIKIEEVEKKIEQERLEKEKLEPKKDFDEFEEELEEEKPIETPEIRRLKHVLHELKHLLHEVKKFEQRLLYLERETYVEWSSGDGDFRTFRQKIRDTGRALMQLLVEEERGAPTRTDMNTAEQLTQPTGQTGNSEVTSQQPETPPANVDMEAYNALLDIQVPAVPERSAGERASAYDRRLDDVLLVLSAEQKKTSALDKKLIEDFKADSSNRSIIWLMEKVSDLEAALAEKYRKVLELQNTPAFLEEKRVEALSMDPEKAAAKIRQLESEVTQLREDVRNVEQRITQQIEEALKKVDSMLQVFGEAQSRAIEQDILQPKLKAFAEIIPDAIREVMAEEFGKWLNAPGQPVRATEATPLVEVESPDDGEEHDLTGVTEEPADTADTKPSAPTATATPAATAPTTPPVAETSTVKPEEKQQPPKRTAATIKAGVTAFLKRVSQPKSAAPEVKPAGTTTHDAKPSTPTATAAPAAEAKPASQPAATAEPAKPVDKPAEKKDEPAKEKPLPTSLELAQQLNPAWTEADLNAAATKAGPLVDRTKRRIEGAIQTGTRLEENYERLNVLPFIANSNAEMKKLVVQYIEKTKK